jgi:hypothetical protein
MRTYLGVRTLASCFAFPGWLASRTFDNGDWADEVRPARGEVAVAVSSGWHSLLTVWVVGTRAEFENDDAPVALDGRRFALGPSDSALVKRARAVYRAS